MNEITSKAKIYLVSFILFSLIITSSYHSYAYPSFEHPNSLVEDSQIANIDNSLEYTFMESMKIESDEDFITLGFPGNGALENPYRIENFQIGGADIATGLFISNVTKHFIITDCQIAAAIAIHIVNIPDVRFNISDNNIESSSFYYPINTLTGIKLVNCGNVSLTLNFIESSYIGLEMISTENILVLNNEFAEKSDEDSKIKYTGIKLRHTENCTFIDNSFTQGGFYFDLDFEQLNTLVLENNSIGDKKILFCKNVTETTISSQIYGQILLFRCKDIIVKNLVLTNLYIGIGIFFSDMCEVYDNIILDCHFGIYDYNSYNTEISNNICDGNSVGIAVVYAKFSILNNNTCINSNFYDGIQLSNSIYSTVENNNCSFNKLGNGILDSSKDSIIMNNVCMNNSYGIHLWFSDYTTIMNNKLNHNSGGIWALDAHDIRIYNNTIEYNTKFSGIIIQNSIEGIISNNLILENVGYGVILNAGTTDYVIHHNSFFNNLVYSNALSQASDDGEGNYWYHPDTLVGNYWSDRGLSSKYKIDGTAESIDLYPLKDPSVQPSDDYTNRSNFFFILTLTALIPLTFNHRKKRRKI